MVYSWTTLWFNYNVPGWLRGLSIGDVFSIFTYSMATNFLESIVVLAGIILFSMILPRKLFLDAFVARGAGLAILGLGFMMLIAKQFSTKAYYPAELIRWAPAVFVAILLIVFFLGRISFLRRVLEVLADRAIIFLYISIPISILSLLAILIRVIT